MIEGIKSFSSVENKEREDEYYEVAVEAAKKAAEYLLENFGGKKEEHLKEGTHHGIEEDKGSDKIIEEHLKEHFPEVAIYSEEGERSLNHEFVWVVDPLDGTTNYSHEMGEFVTQLCLLHKGEPVISVIINPIKNDIFTARKDKGAYLNGEKITIPDVEIEKFNKMRLGINKGSNNMDAAMQYIKLSERIRTSRIFGSMGVDLYCVANGGLSALVNSGSGLYDYAPGVLLIREAGGVAINFAGEDWSSKDRTLIAASNQEIAEEILEQLKKPISKEMVEKLNDENYMEELHNELKQDSSNM